MTFWSASKALEALPGSNAGNLLFDSRELPYYLSSCDEACRRGLQTSAIFKEVRVEVHQVPKDDLSVVEHALDGMQVWRVGR